MDYKKAGVDIEAGYKSVELMKEHVKKTMRPEVLGGLGGFAGAFDLSGIKNMEEPVLLSGTDGCGTKVKLAFVMDKHDTIGIDAVAMCVNDIACSGGEPLFFLDYIACGKNYPEKIASIVSGVAEGCLQSECALVGGETAEHPGLMPEDDYDLAGFSVGIADKAKIISGQNVKAGDVLIGISSSGVHSNGYSFIRKIFLDTYNYKLDQYIEELGMTLGEALLTPTKIYVKLVLDLLKRYDIKSIAHITGGGVIENIPRVIPKGLGIDINKNSWEKPAIFKLIESFNAIDERELHKSFNMGIGLVMVVEKDKAEEVVNFINNREEEIHVDAKYTELMKDRAYIIGEVVDTHEGVNLC